MNIQILGVSGTNGSGKDTLMELLHSKYGYLFVSATDLLATELQRRGLPTDRLHKAELSAEWRRELGMAAVIQKAYNLWQTQGNAYKGLVVGSVRHPGEADAVHGLGGTMVWLDADQLVRYNRIQANAALRGRSAEDAISFVQFQADEKREMQQSGDSATLNMSAVRDRCDIMLENGGEAIDAFQQSIEQALGLA